MEEEGVVKRVVLTGGPSAGKSTIQNILADIFENIGWKVYRVPETATLLLSGGVSFADLSEQQAYQFQKDLLQVMLRIEQTYFNLAETEAAKGRKCLVVSDRGAMDASAYIDKHLWQQILKELSLTDIQLRDQRYDCVVHLVSAADGAEEFYTLANNSSRSEGVELAKKLDQLCQQAWIGHPYFDIVDNSTGFDEKCNRVVGNVLRRLGLEDKRYGLDVKKFKFLVDRSFVMDSKFPVTYQDFTVEHTFLPTSDGSQVRIRRRTQNGISHFNMTVRTPQTGNELRRALTGREYDVLKLQADAGCQSIIKQRRCFLWQQKYYQLDLFKQPSSQKGLLILEAYMNSAEPSKLPDFLPVGLNVTGQREFSMATLALLK